jgi:hypothetical protein
MIIKPARMFVRACTSAALAAAIAGCAPPPRVDFARTPAPTSVTASDYGKVLRRWRRHGHVLHDYDTALEVSVVLLSAEYRAAFVTKMGDVRSLPPQARDELWARQRKAATEATDVVVLMQTSRWEWNDLSSSKSVWTITYADGTGREALATDRVPLDEKLDTLAALYPEVTPFTRAWLVRFPAAFSDGTPLLGPDTRAVSIRFAGPLGKTEMRWDGGR